MAFHYGPPGMLRWYHPAYYGRVRPSRYGIGSLVMVLLSGLVLVGASAVFGIGLGPLAADAPEPSSGQAGVVIVSAIVAIMAALVGVVGFILGWVAIFTGGGRAAGVLAVLLGLCCPVAAFFAMLLGNAVAHG